VCKGSNSRMLLKERGCKVYFGKGTINKPSNVPIKCTNGQTKNTEGGSNPD
ncbi:hypothetical protein J6590_063393, partial [Homalodisca vitripennis]